MINKLASVAVWSIVIAGVYATVLSRMVKNNLTREENVGKHESFKTRVS